MRCEVANIFVLFPATSYGFMNVRLGLGILRGDRISEMEYCPARDARRKEGGGRCFVLGDLVCFWWGVGLVAMLFSYFDSCYVLPLFFKGKAVIKLWSFAVKIFVQVRERHV
ncbi:hypothetical protein B0J14DRAFT_592367 [Halenospora varia]|nr:hypothetical protein B0J14DRAFT_592367 [Halenospora varia]